MGPNLITNGRFDSWAGDNPVDWIPSSEDANNYVTEYSGAARIVSDGTSSVYIAQNMITTAGEVYKLSFDITISINNHPSSISKL